MIVNWMVASQIVNQWAGNASDVDVVLTILEGAITRHDIQKLLTPPDYDISPGQLPVEFVISLHGSVMVGCSLVENSLSADVTIYVV